MRPRQAGMSRGRLNNVPPPIGTRSSPPGQARCAVTRLTPPPRASPGCGGEGGCQVGRLVEVRNRNLPPSRHLARCGGQSHGCLGSRGRGGSSVLRAFRFRQWLIPGLPAVSARLTGSAHGDSMARGSRFLVLPHITELCYGPSDILHKTIATLREPQSQPPCGGETKKNGDGETSKQPAVLEPNRDELHTTSRWVFRFQLSADAPTWLDGLATQDVGGSCGTPQSETDEGKYRGHGRGFAQKS